MKTTKNMVDEDWERVALTDGIYVAEQQYLEEQALMKEMYEEIEKQKAKIIIEDGKNIIQPSQRSF